MRVAAVLPGASPSQRHHQCSPAATPWSHRPLPVVAPRSGRSINSRRTNNIRPMAMFSRYDPFGVWPPYKGTTPTTNTTSSSSSSGSASSGRPTGEQRLAAVSPAQRQAMLSSAISGVTEWQQLYSIVERYGRYMSVNNVTHALTKLEQVVRGRQYLPAEAAQVEDLLEWLLQRGRELNATAQLGPQGLGATAGAVSRLQQAQRQQLQQQQQQQQQQAAARAAALRQQQQQQQEVQQVAAAAEAAARQQQAAAAERDQLMRELVDAAVAQKHRLTPQALNNLLSALADIEESNMTADEIRQLLHLPPTKGTTKAVATAGAAAPTSTSTAASGRTGAQVQQQQQALGRQQQQQQAAGGRTSSSSNSSSSNSNTSRPMSPDSLQATARQLGQLSPELAQEWYDRALRQGLEQGYIPRGIDKSYVSGFLAREIERAAARALEASSTSSSSSRVPGAALLLSVVSKYGQLMGVDHLALAVHKLAELRQQEAAGADQEVEAAAGTMFELLQPLVSAADAATISSLVSSCKDLRLYSKTLVQACLARARTLMEQQLRGLVGVQAGFSGRRLGVLLHSLAVLGLKPSDSWLRLAVTAAGELLPSCSLTDLERLASALIIMRVDPGPQWTAAAEDVVEQQAAALGSSSDSRRLPHLKAAAAVGDGDDGDDDDDISTGNARKALVACVKALALLGGQRANAWYQSILAAEEQQQMLMQQRQDELQQRQQEQQEKQAEQQLRQQRQQEYLQQQAALQAAQQQKQQQQKQQQKQAAPATGPQHVERQLEKAVKQQHQGPKLHLHPHHHLQHRNPAAKKQQQASTSSNTSSSSSPGVGALTSLDDFMSQELLQQQKQQQQKQQQVNRQQAMASSSLPKPHTSVSVPDEGDSTAAGAGAGAGAGAPTAGGRPASGVEAAAPAAWASEQTSRWAQTRGEAAQPSPAAEVQQRLDDSKKMFGDSSSSSSSTAAKRGGGGAGRQSDNSKAAAASGRAGQIPSLGKGQPQSQTQQAAARPLKSSSAAREIPVAFDDADKPSSSSSSGKDKSESRDTATAAAAEAKGQQQQQQVPSKQAQRSAAEAADALAALMAEIETEGVPEEDHEQVLKELGLAESGPDSLAESRAQAAELQEAADLVMQATQQLDDLQKHHQKQQQKGQQQQQKGQQKAADADAAKALQKQQQHHTKHDKKQPKQQQQQRTPAGGAGGGANKATAAAKRPLGSSGEAAFVAAAKALQGPKKPSRTLLLGCLEAIEQQQQQLKTKLAEKQAMSAVAGAAARQRASSAAAQDPAARKLQQLKQDFDRARERAAQEKAGVRATAAAEVLGRLLPLLDSFEAAEAALDQQQRQQQGAGGGNEREVEEARRVYNALHAQLLSIIKAEGARIVGQDGELVGKPFDPEEMEAVMRQPAPAGFADGDVLQVLRKGYAVGNRLVRPALVVVAYDD